MCVGGNVKKLASGIINDVQFSAMKKKKKVEWSKSDKNVDGGKDRHLPFITLRHTPFIQLISTMASFIYVFQCLNK
jgi:hypothetical protein